MMTMMMIGMAFKAEKLNGPKLSLRNRKSRRKWQFAVEVVQAAQYSTGLYSHPTMQAPIILHNPRHVT